jgi:predicted peptidase
MGGYTAWTAAMTKPELFAALIPVCGGGMYWNANKLKEIPIWAFHGALDKVVYVTESIHMVNAVNQCGGNAKLTIYPDIAHNSWEKAFATDELYNWLLDQKRGK